MVANASRNNTNPREWFLYQHVRHNPGINAADLCRYYNKGYSVEIDVSGDVLRLLGRGVLERGKPASGRGIGLYAVTREAVLRTMKRCAWCGKPAERFYCPEHMVKKRGYDAKRRERKQALSMVVKEVVSDTPETSST